MIHVDSVLKCAYSFHGWALPEQFQNSSRASGWVWSEGGPGKWMYLLWPQERGQEWAIMITLCCNNYGQWRETNKKKTSQVLSQKLSKLSKKMRAKYNLKSVDPRMLDKESLLLLLFIFTSLPLFLSPPPSLGVTHMCKYTREGQKTTFRNLNLFSPSTTRIQVMKLKSSGSSSIVFIHWTILLTLHHHHHHHHQATS